MQITSSTSPLAQANWSRPAAPAQQGERAGGKLKGLDTDQSGSISAAEFGLDDASTSEAVKTMFKAIDTDGSGDLSKDEVQQFREQLRAAAQANPPVPTDPAQAGQGIAVGERGSKDPHHFLDKLAARYAQMTNPSPVPPDVNVTA